MNKLKTIETKTLSNLGILMCDDEPGLLKIMQIMLKDSGADVFVASTKEESMSTYMTNRDKIDIVLLDWRIPEARDGETIFNFIKEISDNVEIIITSGMNPSSRLKESLKSKNTYYLEKPFDFQELTNIIVNVVS